jgi:hypothetical protein
VNAALKKAGPSSLVSTLDATIDIDDVENVGIYGVDYDIDNEGNLSYHLFDRLDKNDSVGDLSLGHSAEGTSPPAYAHNTAGQSLLRKQNDDPPDWLQEMIANQAYRLSHLLSAPVTKCFPCIACKNRINIDNPHEWIHVFLR